MEREEFKEILTVADRRVDGARFSCRITVPAVWMDATFENALRRRVEDPHLAIPGFRPGKAPPALLRAKLAQPAREDAVRWVLDDAARIFVEEEKLLFLSDFTCEHKDWQHGKDFEAEMEAAVWSPLDIEVEKLRAALQGETDSEAVLSALRQAYASRLDPAAVNRLAAEFGGTSPEIVSRVEDTLLLDSLALRLGVSIEEAEINRKLAQLAVEAGLSMFELQDRLEQFGGKRAVVADLRREKALERLAGGAD